MGNVVRVAMSFLGLVCHGCDEQPCAWLPTVLPGACCVCAPSIIAQAWCVSELWEPRALCCSLDIAGHPGSHRAQCCCIQTGAFMYQHCFSRATVTLEFNSLVQEVQICWTWVPGIQLHPHVNGRWWRMLGSLLGTLAEGQRTGNSLLLSLLGRRSWMHRWWWCFSAFCSSEGSLHL